jgi:hypothetical protein
MKNPNMSIDELSKAVGITKEKLSTDMPKRGKHIV